MRNIIKIMIALVWLINGLYCKILNLVPRHEIIVSEILGSRYAHEITIGIGVLEILMCLWILSNIYPKLNAITQIFTILLMNIIEFISVPHLLLWGRFNILFAIFLCLVIYMNTFKIKQLKSRNYAANF
ncbi:MAG: DoxX-like family protein [Jejuia sp.]